jgi:chaperonin cofactor prefoldin
MREHELTPKDVEYVAEKLLNIQELEQSETNLKNRVEQLCSQRMKLRFDLDGMQQRWGMLEKYCDQLKDEIDLLEFRIRKLNKERMAVEEEKEDYKE